MEIEFTKQAQLDLTYWKKSENKIVQNKISELLEDLQVHPFEGIGKPED